MANKLKTYFNQNRNSQSEAISPSQRRSSLPINHSSTSRNSNILASPTDTLNSPASPTTTDTHHNNNNNNSSSSSSKLTEKASMSNSFGISSWSTFFGRRSSRAEDQQQQQQQLSPNSTNNNNNESQQPLRRRRSSSSPGRRPRSGSDPDNNNNDLLSPRSLQSRRGSSASQVNNAHNNLINSGGSGFGGLEDAIQDIYVSRRPSTDGNAANDYKFPIDKPARIKLVPYNPCFLTAEKEMTNGSVITIGRYQRSQQGGSADGNDGIYFRSTVVSRTHAQLMFINGEFFMKDTKSLGGTFINSSRLSSAGKESYPHKIYHGDVLQFGVDYRPDQRTGQVRSKDKCVEVMVEFPSLNKKHRKKQPKPTKWEPAAHKHTECCICLSALYLKQALFIAPCAHTFHYRCIAPLLHKGKGFTCPMCRQDSDLKESLWSLNDYTDSDFNDDEDEESHAGNNDNSGNNDGSHSSGNPMPSSAGAGGRRGTLNDNTPYMPPIRDDSGSSSESVNVRNAPRSRVFSSETAESLSNAAAVNNNSSNLVASTELEPVQESNINP